jgi:tRNA (adenine57-N1/adenine58-N1)-methyltransferase catalytic subunit
LSQIIEEGGQVLLYQDARRKWVTRVSKTKFHTHRGFVELAETIGKKYGETVKTSMGQPLFLFRPRAIDLVEVFDRPTQILYPKDIGYSLYQLGVAAGSRVLEVGTGSGAMTACLARAVQPGGHVYSYEMRPEFLRAARANIEKAGLSGIVTLHNKDPTEGFGEEDVDAVVVDLGDPWKMVAPAWKALTGGGMLAGFTPTTNQLEKLAEALRIGGFVILEAVEVMLRQLKTEMGKLRPESRMVGHTAYVTIARKVQPTG